jgi:hypothetical protein
MTENEGEGAAVDGKTFFLYYTLSGRIEKVVLSNPSTEAKGDTRE